MHIAWAFAYSDVEAQELCEPLRRDARVVLRDRADVVLDDACLEILRVELKVAVKPDGGIPRMCKHGLEPFARVAVELW